MAKPNISDLSTFPQFLKDQISTKERLFICGIQCDHKHPVTKYRSARKNDPVIHHFFKKTKAVLA